jgi:hypothetical protein
MTQPQVHQPTTVHVYEDDFPRRLGPPPVPNYSGRKILDATKPVYTVELDSGAFMALWEHMEAEAKFRFPTHADMAGARAYLRVVAALRRTYWANHEPPPPEPKPVRKLVRRGRS